MENGKSDMVTISLDRYRHLVESEQALWDLSDKVMLALSDNLSTILRIKKENYND